MKALIFDSGPLINFTLNGLLPVLEQMKKRNQIKFLITTEVKREIYDHPVTIKQFELGALRMRDLLDRSVLETPESLGISSELVTQQTRELTDKANHSLQADGQWIPLVSEAEMSCFALANILKEKRIESMMAVDERTARMLAEKPESLAKLMAQKLHRNVKLIIRLKELKDMKCVRSSELLYVAYKQGLFILKDPRTLESLLYASKFKGSSISWDEIEQLKKL
ncbi:MAG: hypothetical protein AABX12_02010 [Nanoarchaeota archaeon]